MSEAKLTFEREDREGVIPVGSYLSDAARRFGIRFEEKCVPGENLHFCAITVKEGEPHLTPYTAAEKEHFTAETNGTHQRLACQVKIIESGEIVIMTPESKNESKEPEVEAKEKYAKEFADLPLEKKIAELVQLEAMTLSETFSFILNSPYLVFDKVMDVMAEFGMKKEEQGKQAARPQEHAATGKETKAKGKAKKAETTGNADNANADKADQA